MLGYKFFDGNFFIVSLQPRKKRSVRVVSEFVTQSRGSS